jgi:hypothetical protein
MSNPVTCTIKGLDELEKKLLSLPKVMQEEVVGKALEAGAEIVVDQIIKRAPERTGFLKEHFRKIFHLNRQSGIAIIGPDPDADYPATGKE